jgi:hypothetical protein
LQFPSLSFIVGKAIAFPPLHAQQSACASSRGFWQQKKDAVANLPLCYKISRADVMLSQTIAASRESETRWPQKHGQLRLLHHQHASTSTNEAATRNSDNEAASHGMSRCMTPPNSSPDDAARTFQYA